MANFIRGVHPRYGNLLEPILKDLYISYVYGQRAYNFVTDGFAACGASVKASFLKFVKINIPRGDLKVEDIKKWQAFSGITLLNS